MKIEIPMPKMGESIMEGTIIKWHKNVGDSVKKDETIFEISTDKVDTEVPSPSDGVLTEIIFKENETVEVGKIVAYIETKMGKSVGLISDEKITEKKSDKKIEQNTINIVMPKMGESIMEGTIIKWHKNVGDSVKKDETIFEISTDKVDTEVPSPEDGILIEIISKEQEIVPVGEVVARLSSESSTTSIIVAQNDSMHSQIGEMISTTLIDEKYDEVKEKQKSNKFYSPLVLNIAKVENVTFEELEKISGTGIEGRVTKKDILEYVENRVRKSSLPIDNKKLFAQEEKSIKQITPSVYSYSDGSVEKIPMDNIRQKIMNHMVHSRDTSVHVTGLVEVDMSKIYNFLKSQKENIWKREGIKLTYTSFVAYAVVKALKVHPLINSTIDGTSILQKKFVNLGIAVALEQNGLIVPNIKNAQDKNLFGLSKEISSLAEKARTKKLTPDDISGGTFTITNYGIFGTLFGTPIINQPEIAILGMGAVVKRPIVVETDDQDSIIIKPMMYLTLSHDHRLIDGMLGGMFLKTIKEQLESFNEKTI